MGKRPFVGFTRDDFAQTSRIFWDNGYRAADQVRDMDPEERDLPFKKRNTTRAAGDRCARIYA